MPAYMILYETVKFNQIPHSRLLISIISSKDGITMALIQVDFYSETLRKIVPIKAIIPNDPDLNPTKKKAGQHDNMQTLYLLHGYSGNYTDWVSGTRILDYAREYNLAVIMPSGENSFYLDDHEKSEYFGEYIGRELVDYTRRLFRLSHLREDTFIGGLSMGGYGALRNGLKYAETFSKIISFSGAFIYLKIIENGCKAFDDEVTSAPYKKRVFGDLNKLAASDKNPVYLAERLKREEKAVPEIMMTCGTEDSLVSLNRKIKNQLNNAGIEIKYVEDTGSHDWYYWNKHLEEALRWLAQRQD